MRKELESIYEAPVKDLMNFWSYLRGDYQAHRAFGPQAGADENNEYYSVGTFWWSLNDIDFYDEPHRK